MAPSPAESRPTDSGEELSAAFLERLKGEPLRELTVLDAGTGSGRVALALAPLCRAVVGVDRDARAIDEARRKAAAAKLSNVRFVVGDVEVEEYVPFKPDAVVAYLCMSDAIAERASRALRAGQVFAFVALHNDQWKETGRPSRFAYGGTTWQQLTDRSARIAYPDQVIIHPEKPDTVFMAGAICGPGSWRESKTADARSRGLSWS